MASPEETPKNQRVTLLRDSKTNLRHPSGFDSDTTAMADQPRSRADQPRSQVIEQNPIGKGLEAFRTSFHSVCKDRNISCSPDALTQLSQEDVQVLASSLLSALQVLPIARLLPSKTGRGTLRSDLLRLISAAASDDFDSDRITPLLQAALEDSSDTRIWDQVNRAVTESTPPPRPIASSLQQTPWIRTTGSLANSSEKRKYVDEILDDELGAMYVGVPGFIDAFFGDVAELETVSKAVFQKCTESKSQLYHEGWSLWPKDAKQDDVLNWFETLSQQLADLAVVHWPRAGRRLQAQPDTPIRGSKAIRKLDIGFVADLEPGVDPIHWRDVLVPGELKSNPSADASSKTWLDLGRYAREVFAAQNTRRFVLGFTLCGPLMRVWLFDRLGAVASERFDVNKDGLQFVNVVLGFLWMDEFQLGFDPTILTEDGQQFIEVTRKGQAERLLIKDVISRTRCVAGRATTCWTAHPEKDPKTILVIKDSWQYPERKKEGELLLKITEKDVLNVAKYYHHFTVQVGGKEDDIRNNVRRGLDVTAATIYRPQRSGRQPGTAGGSQSSTANRKRSSSYTDAPLPPSKRRSCSASPSKAQRSAELNRQHERLILVRYGEPIYEARSPASLLAILEDGIVGHESARDQANILHRDISQNNIRWDEKSGFLIDFDLSVEEAREKPSGARNKTGTRAFMAIGVLFGEQHSFMHDLESFFWVLFWICIHYDGPGREKVVPRFEQWNYVNIELAELKKGVISHEGDFFRTIGENFTPFYQPLTNCVNRLRKVVFPNGGRWEREDKGLYGRMRAILQEAQNDPLVLGQR